MPTMSWCEVSVRVLDEARADRATRGLFAEGAVAVERRGDETVGAFVDDEQAREAARTLGAILRGIPPPDWSGEWLAEHKPFVISERLVVAPRFVDAPPARVVLRIDPGLAFGTAAHPTTFLCLQAIDRLLSKGAPASVLDVGCGTGVLAIAALRLGARRAIGTDVDPVALRTARRCARSNGLSEERLELSQGAPDTFGAHPLVVANLPPEPLEALAPAIARAVAPDGVLLVSGFFSDLVPAMARPFLRAGLQQVGVHDRQGWGLVELRR